MPLSLLINLTASLVIKKSDIFTDLSIWIFPAKIGLVGGSEHTHNILLFLMSAYR